MSKNQYNRRQRELKQREASRFSNEIAGHVASGGGNRGKAQIRGEGKRAGKYLRSLQYHTNTWVRTVTPKN